MESYVRICGEGFSKSYVPLRGGREVKNCQNHPDVINEWPLRREVSYLAITECISMLNLIWQRRTRCHTSCRMISHLSGAKWKRKDSNFLPCSAKRPSGGIAIFSREMAPMSLPENEIVSLACQLPKTNENRLHCDNKDPGVLHSFFIFLFLYPYLLFPLSLISIYCLNLFFPRFYCLFFKRNSQFICKIIKMFIGLLF